jgi:hypothetical protein
VLFHASQWATCQQGRSAFFAFTCLSRRLAYCHTSANKSP